jgi:hypothetical protein
MSARLSGADFEIVTAPNSEVQTGIDLEEDTTWQWQIRPKRAAPSLQLTVTLTAILQVDGIDRPRDERVFTHTMAVNARPLSWTERALDIWTAYKPTSDFLWGTAFAAVVPFVVRLLKPSRRARKGEWTSRDRRRSAMSRPGRRA